MRNATWLMLACGGLFLGLSAGGSAQEKKKDAKPPVKKEVYTDPKEAGPDFLLQGEYAGELSGKDKLGAQVVAKGSGAFEVYILTGGLPGAGWDTKGRAKVQAKTEGGKTSLVGSKWTGSLGGGKLIGKNPEGGDFILERVERKSPSSGMKAPAGALILFDGASAEHWGGGKIVEDNLLFCGTSSKKGIAAGKFHIEFRTPFQPKAGGQGRGNSGVYIQGSEVQVLDSFGLEGKDNECGGFYGKAKPAVNMCLPPLSWQTYDIEITSNDKKQTVATVYHNGVKIHDNIVLKNSPPTPTTVNLQNHGNPVMYRNIWFVEEK